MKTEIRLCSDENRMLVLVTEEGEYTFEPDKGVELAIVLLQAAHYCGAKIDLGKLFCEMRKLK